MSRVKRGIMKNKRKSKILKLAKGYRNARSTKYKQAKQAVIRAGQHAFAHRRRKKRVMRKDWQIKISYAVQALAGLSYSRFIDQLTKKGVQVDRKIMNELIVNDMEAFARFVSEVTGETVSAPKVAEVKKEVAKVVKEEKEEETKEAAEDAQVEKEEKEEETKEAAEDAQVEKEEKTSTDADDLTKVEGVGPVIAKTLTEAGIATYAELAKAKTEKIQELIADVRGNHDSETWPKQAEMAAEGKWDELKTWQDEMDGGKA